MLVINGKMNCLFLEGFVVKKVVIPILIVLLTLSLSLFVGCENTSEAETTTTVPTTEKAPGKYADSEYLGSWYNADAKDILICTLNDDGTATFKGDEKATWTETETGITITSSVDGKKTTKEGYFVIAGEGYVARATDANMHYLDEGGIIQLEIMLTENTCVDCVKK